MAAAPYRVEDLFPPEWHRAVLASRRRQRAPAAAPTAGARRSRTKGDGLEFADHRPYSAGDDPRFVDWSAWARFRHLVIKRYEVDHDRPLTVLVDDSASFAWGEPPKDRVGRQAAGTLLAKARMDLDRVQLWAGGAGEPRRVAVSDSGGGGEGTLRMLDALARCPRRPGAGGLAATASGWLRQAPGRGPLAWVSDFWGDHEDDGPAAVAILAASGRPFLLVQVTSRDEEEGEPPGEHELESVETGSRLRVAVTAASATAYRARVAAYRGRLVAACRAGGGAFLRLDSACGPVELVRQLATP